jgi:hypothetical protein
LQLEGLLESIDSGEFLKATPTPFCNLVARDLFHDELTKNTAITSPSSFPPSLIIMNREMDLGVRTKAIS